jgi:hypothetical protein
MSKSDWIKEHDSTRSIVWRNRKKNDVTIEAHILDDDPDSEPTWYAYGAVGGRGVPSSPAIVERKSDAIRIIASLKKSYKNNGISGFGR